jgi:hypothetical protein
MHADFLQAAGGTSTSSGSGRNGKGRAGGRKRKGEQDEYEMLSGAVVNSDSKKKKIAVRPSTANMTGEAGGSDRSATLPVVS